MHISVGGTCICGGGGGGGGSMHMFSWDLWLSFNYQTVTIPATS